MKTLLLLLAATLPGWGQSVNPDSRLIQDFESRIADYVKQRHEAEESVHGLKPTASREKISHYERELAEHIRKARKGETQGNIFTPEISVEFRRLIALAMQGADSAHVHQSLRHAEPVKVLLRVGGSWPDNVPLQSTPPTLLMDLPSLDPVLDYRVAGNSLVLRDAKASVIIDYLPNAIP
jgi:hypothetical protein